MIILFCYLLLTPDDCAKDMVNGWVIGWLPFGITRQAEPVVIDQIATSHLSHAMNLLYTDKYYNIGKTSPKL